MITDPPIMSALVGGVTLTALVMTILALSAYARARRIRFLFVSAAFAVLFVRGVLVTAGLFLEYPWSSIFAVAALTDAFLLLLLYLAVVR